MILDRTIQVVDSHTAGEPTRVVLGGIGKILGKTMVEKKAYFAGNLDHLRSMLMQEPRGHLGMVGAVLTEPTSQESSFGVIYMDAVAYVDMCVHGSIGLVTTALESGIVPKVEPQTEVVFDTPAGKVTAIAHVSDGTVLGVSVLNVPSYVAHGSSIVEDPLIGSIDLDVAFGGNFYALVDAKKVGVSVKPENIDRLARIAISLRDSANRQIEVKHPLLPHISKISGVLFYDNESKNPDSNSRNVVIGALGKFDRSPCGTGTSARMASLHAKDELKVNEPFLNESIIGTTFVGKIVREEPVGEFKGIVPMITGSAYLTGYSTFVVSRNDPLSTGFCI